MPARPRTLIALAAVALLLLAWTAPRLWTSGAGAERPGGSKETEAEASAEQGHIDPRVREIQPDASCVPPARRSAAGRSPRCVLSFGRAIALGVEPGGTLAVIAVTHASTAAWSLPALAFARPLQALDVESEAAVILVSEARDEALLAVGPDLLRYSTASGRVVERRQGPDGMLQDAAWSADGGVVAVAAAADGTAYVLERGSGRARALRTEGRAIHVAVDAAGEVVAVATEIGVVALFSTRDEAAPPRVATPSLQPPGELAFAGDLLWIAGSDGVLRALDGSGAEVARSAVGSPLVALAIAPGGRLAATAARDRIVRIHALAGGDAVEALAWHASRVTGVAFGAGRTLLSADVDGELAAWDLPPPP